MAAIKTILVPTDFSEPATHALKYANALAKRVGATITVMYADTFLPPLDYISELAIWSDTTAPIIEERAQKHLEEDIAAYVDPEVRSKAIIAIATAADGILEHVKQGGVDLIVMGTHGRSGLPRAILGSVTETVMREAPVPVLAVPPNSPLTASMNAIVCPVEENTRGVEALRLAATLAPADAQFFVVGSVAEDTIEVTDDIAAIEKWTPAELRGRAKFMVVSAGRVADKVSRLAMSVYADLIVGTEPKSRRIGEVFAGTFAEKLLQHHACPVLTLNERAVVRAPDIEAAPAEFALT